MDNKTKLIQLFRDFIINNPAYKSKEKEAGHIRNYTLRKNNPKLASDPEFAHKNYKHVGNFYERIIAKLPKHINAKFGHISSEEEIEKLIRFLDDDEKLKELVKYEHDDVWYPKLYFVLPKDIENIEENKHVIITKSDSYFKELEEKNVPVKTHRYIYIFKYNEDAKTNPYFKPGWLFFFNTYITIPEIKGARDLRDALIGVNASFNPKDLIKELDKENDLKYFIAYAPELMNNSYPYKTERKIKLRKPRWDLSTEDIKKYEDALHGIGEYPLLYELNKDDEWTLEHYGSGGDKSRTMDKLHFLDAFIGLELSDLYFTLYEYADYFVEERVKDWLRAKMMYEIASKTDKFKDLTSIGFKDIEDIEFYKKIFKENYKFPLKIDKFFIFPANIREFDEQQFLTNLNYAVDLLGSIVYDSYKNIDLPVFYAVDFTKYMLPLTILPFEKPETSERILNILFSKGNREEKIQAFKEVLYKDIFKDGKSAEEFARKAMKFIYKDTTERYFDYFEAKDYVKHEILPLFKDEFEKYLNIIALYIPYSFQYGWVSAPTVYPFIFRFSKDYKFAGKAPSPLVYSFDVEFNKMFDLDDVMEEFFEHKYVKNRNYVMMVPKFEIDKKRREIMRQPYPYRGIIETLDVFAKNLDDIVEEFKRKQKYAPINTLNADAYLLAAERCRKRSIGLEPYLDNLQYLIYESMKDQYAKYKDVVLKNYL